MRYTYEISELTPGERLTMRTADGPFPMTTTYEWHDAGDAGAHMTLRNQGQPAGFARIVRPLMAVAMRRANTKDLRRPRAILEH
jgi:hypothetical protein